jgi:SAM-dependent methyltransferase
MNSANPSASGSATSVPPFGHGQNIQRWIEDAIAQPFNPNELNPNTAAQTYDPEAANWERKYLTEWNYYRDVKTLENELVTHLPLGPKALVLDLGGATGKLAKFLVQMGLARKVISLDISPNMTRQAQHEFNSLNLSTENATGKPVSWELIAVCADMTMPIKDQPQLKELLSDGVDVVISLRAFSTLPPATAIQTLKTMRTLLRPGGRILVDNKPPRPFVRHAVCFPNAVGLGSKYPKLYDIMIHGFADRSTIVFDNESPALVDLQKASLNHLAHQCNLKLQHMTHGHLPERGINTSTDFLSLIRNQLKQNTPPYDELSAPPMNMLETMYEAFRYLTAENFHNFNRMWRDEVGVNTEIPLGWTAHEDDSEYYAIFSVTESMD